MAKETKKHRAKRRFTLALAPIAGLFPVVRGVYERRNVPTDILGFMQGAFTGIDPNTKKFNFTLLRNGVIPVLAGVGIHFAANKIGLNRLLQRAHVPVIRI